MERKHFLPNIIENTQKNNVGVFIKNDFWGTSSRPINVILDQITEDIGLHHIVACNDKLFNQIQLKTCKTFFGVLFDWG
jgi:hypothetical protein